MIIGWTLQVNQAKMKLRFSSSFHSLITWDNSVLIVGSSVVSSDCTIRCSSICICDLFSVISSFNFSICYCRRNKRKQKLHKEHEKCVLGYRTIRKFTWICKSSGLLVACSVSLLSELVQSATSPASILTCSCRRSIWSTMVVPLCKCNKAVGVNGCGKYPPK